MWIYFCLRSWLIYVINLSNIQKNKPVSNIRPKPTNPVSVNFFFYFVLCPFLLSVSFWNQPYPIEQPFLIVSLINRPELKKTNQFLKNQRTNQFLKNQELTNPWETKRTKSILEKPGTNQSLRNQRKPIQSCKKNRLTKFPDPEKPIEIRNSDLNKPIIQSFPKTAWPINFQYPPAKIRNV